MKYAMIGLMLVITTGCSIHNSSPYVTARDYTVNTVALDAEMKKIREDRIKRKDRATVITPDGVYTIYY
jgi:hypothetical protein